jgi:hypothetical protein
MSGMTILHWQVMAFVMQLFEHRAWLLPCVDKALLLGSTGSD